MARGDPHRVWVPHASIVVVTSLHFYTIDVIVLVYHEAPVRLVNHVADLHGKTQEGYGRFCLRSASRTAGHFALISKVDQNGIVGYNILIREGILAKEDDVQDRGLEQCPNVVQDLIRDTYDM
jgi:hypothetical protein